MKRFEGFILLLVIGGLMPGVTGTEAAVPPGATESFLEGNRRYVENDFLGAVEAYESVVSLGVTASVLEYNLGNAYLKANKNGLAILHYRRALKLAPRFEAAQANLEYIRASARDIISEDASRDDRMAWMANLRLGPRNAAFGMFCMFTLFLGVAGLRLNLLRGKVWSGVLQGALGTLVLLLGAALIFEWSELEGKHEGVVVVSEVEVRSGPAETYTVSFRLHEGTEVEVLRKSSGWHEVKVSDRLQGWVPEGIVAEI